MNLLDNFQRYIRRNELAAPEDFILLTVSGGVDSMVMLSLFVRSGYRVGVAHCNFQLRGVESEEDEELVRREAEKYGVPWYNKRFDTKGEMERTGESMEMAARRLRYAWFDELSREHGYTVVAIAHHIDDSIETFFINLLRGTGLRGLTGITTHAGKLIRPLMFASRKDILEYAVAQHIPYREDSSNRSTKYLRNKIRLGLVPRIKEISPKFTDLMRQNIGRLTDAQLFINHGIQRIREEVITTENGIDTIHIDRIDRAFPLNFVIFELLNSTYSFKGDVSDALVRALEQNSGTGKRFYSKSHVAYIDRGRIMVTPIPADDLLLIPGAVSFYDGYALRSLRPAAAVVNYGVPYPEYPTSAREAACMLALQAAVTADNRAAEADIERAAVRTGVQAVIRCDGEGFVHVCDEAPLFAVKGKKVYTPPAPPSVERELACRAVEAARLPLLELEIGREQLARFDEIFYVDHRGLTSLSACEGQLYAAIITERIARVLNKLY